FRPEVAVLLAYAKMTLYDELLASDLPDDPYLLGDLIKYFPRPLRKRFPGPIAQHRLRREIIATLVANSLVNRGLGEFVGELSDQTGRSTAAVARAYLIARDAFRLVPLFGQIEALARGAGADYQIGLLGEARLAIARGTEWFLRNASSPIDMGAAVARFAPGIASLLDQLDLILPDVEQRRFSQAVETHLQHGIEAGLARRLAGLPYLFPACEVIAVADQVGTEVVTAGQTYFALDAQLHLGRLRRLLERVSPRNHWERIALAGLYEDLAEEHRRLAVQAFASGLVQGLDEGGADALQAAILAWLNRAVAGFGRWQRLLAELDSQSSPDLAMLSVAVRSLALLDGTQAEAA
ncbi:MAG: gdh, partial [Geminicoccaceae bacterium]|nr:gdh [Geminicoccaceae bacterium]